MDRDATEAYTQNAEHKTKSSRSGVRALHALSEKAARICLPVTFGGCNEELTQAEKDGGKAWRFHIKTEHHNHGRTLMQIKHWTEIERGAQLYRCPRPGCVGSASGGVRRAPAHIFRSESQSQRSWRGGLPVKSSKQEQLKVSLNLPQHTHTASAR